MRKVAGVLALTLVLTTTAAIARPAMTRDQALALAQTSSLMASDMPGYDASPASPPDKRADARVARCAGTVPTTKTLADYPSDDFQRSVGSGFEQAGSEVEVYPSAALVRKDLKASATRRAQKCFLDDLLRHGSTKDTKVLSARLSLIKVTGGLGYRVTSKLRIGGKKTTTLVTDALVRGIGPVEAVVISTTDGKPGAIGRVKDLLKIVSNRVADYLKAMNGSAPS